MKRQFVTIKSQPYSASEAQEASSATSAERLEALAYQSKELAVLIAKNPETPSTLLEKLATPGRLMVRTNPPLHNLSPWTSPDCFSWEVDDDVLQQIVKNPNTPPQMLWLLASQFPKEAAQNPAFALVFLEHPDLIYQTEVTVLVKLLASGEFPHLVDTIVNHPITEARVFFAGDPKIPREVLKKFLQDPSEEVRSAALHNRKWNPKER